MLTLAFDTATRWGRFALAEDGELLAEQPHNVAGSYADALLPVVEELCAAAQRPLAGVRAVAVAKGPGSFTGVRIAVATAKGLAYALDAKLAAVPTTAAMAAALLADHPQAEWAIPVLDARRGELYAGVYRRRQNWVTEVVAPAPLSPEEWWTAISAAVTDVETPVYGGDGLAMLVGVAGVLRPELRGRGRPVNRLWSAAHPKTAASLARAVSAGNLADAEIHPFGLVPLYLRGSDAELKKKVDLTPATPAERVDIHRAQTASETAAPDPCVGDSSRGAGS